jgi:hypothetical protein
MVHNGEQMIECSDRRPGTSVALHYFRDESDNPVAKIENPTGNDIAVIARQDQILRSGLPRA